MASFHPEILVALFWGSAFILFFTFVGYPLLIGGLARWVPKGVSETQPTALPTVSVVLVVYNGEKQIRGRLTNLLSQDYPIREIVVVSDGSNDGTCEVVAAMGDDRLKLIPRATRCGKSACLNVAMQKAGGEIVVLADARQEFRPDTVSILLKSFSDQKVGAVSGSLEIRASSSGIGEGVGAYWNLEKKLRHAESQRDSCIGCTGAVYAIRRSLFQELPEDTLLDDVVIPMRIALAGHRVIFNPDAIAYDPQSLDPEKERVRKRRTLAGNFQMLFRYPGWILPWKNRLWWQLVSHKYLRILAPLFLAISFGSNCMLLGQGFYRFLFAMQAGFYLFAILGGFQPFKKHRLFSFSTSFVFLNLMVLRGLCSYLLEKNDGTWERASAAETRQK